MSVSCPSILELEAAAAGDITPEPVLQHVQVCEPCRRKLDDMAANNRFLQQIRPQLAARTTETPTLGPSVVHGFELLEEISRGGQGVVYRALQSTTKRPAAVKMLLAGALASDRQRARFHREIEIAARLRHPGIVSVFESGVTIDGRQFVAMEYVEGVPLDIFLRRHWPLETSNGRARTAAILRLMASVASAAGHAHAAGVIHRDLKPSNILVDAAGAPRILDFGLARADDSSRDVSVTQEFVGTLGYAAPEQLSGQPGAATSRTDVYALGVLLYTSLTERHPYPCDGPFVDVARHILSTEPAPPSTLVPRLPHDIDTIVLKALAKDPARRYQSAGALAADIDDHLAGRPISARRDSTMYVLSKLAKKHRVPAAAAAAILVTIIGALVGLAVLARDLERERSAAIGALRESAVHRARLLGAAGETASAERLLWEEAFRSGLDPRDPLSAYSESAEVRRAAWALAEFYSRIPRVARVQMSSDAYAWIDPGAESFSAIASDGATARWSFQGELLSGAPPWRSSEQPYALSATAHGEQLVFWDSQGLHHVAPFERRAVFGPLPDFHARTRAAISRDGLWIAAAEDSGRLTLLDARSGDRLAILHQGVLPLGGPSFTASGMLAAGVQGEERPEIRLWRAPDPEPVRVIPIPDTLIRPTHDPFRHAATTPDGRLLAAVVAGVVAVWNEESNEPFAIISGAAAQPLYVQFSPDASTLRIADLQGSVTEWSLPDLQPLPTIEHGAPVIFFSRDEAQDLTIVTDGDACIALYESPPRSWLRTMARRDVPVHAIAISPDGSNVICGDEQGNVDLVPLNSGSSPPHTIKVSRTLISGLRWRSETSALATSVDGVLREIDLSGEPAARNLFDAAGALWTVDRDAHGRVTVAAGAELLLWPDPALPPIRIAAHERRIPCVAVSPDGSKLTTVSVDGAAAIWDAGDGRLLHQLHGFGRFVRAVAWSADGAMLATAGDDRAVRIWSPLTGELIRSIDGLGRDVFDLKFHPSGRILFAATRSPDVLVIDPIAGAHLASFRTHERLVFKLDISPDGGTLVSAGEDPWISVWDLGGLFRYIPGNADYWRDVLQ